MKNNTLLLVASLAVLAASAAAAQNQTENEPVVLPAYVVVAPRCLPVERQINASLDEFRKQAQAPVAIAPEFSVLKAQVDRGSRRDLATQNVKPVRVAGL